MVSVKYFLGEVLIKWSSKPKKFAFKLNLFIEVKKDPSFCSNDKSFIFALINHILHVRKTVFHDIKFSYNLMFSTLQKSMFDMNNHAYDFPWKLLF